MYKFSKRSKIHWHSILVLLIVALVQVNGQNETNSTTEASTATTKLPIMSNDTEIETTTTKSQEEIEQEELEHLKEEIDSGVAELEIIEKDFDNPGWLPLPPNYKMDEIPPQKYFPGYDKITDKKEKRPFQAAVLVNIRGINSIDINAEKITLDMDLYTFWADRRFHLNDSMEAERNPPEEKQKRLRSHQIRIEVEKLHPDFVKTIWAPDIIIENALIIPHNDVTGEPLVSFNTETGFVRYVRLEVSIPCPMQYFYYPLDTQRCEVNIRSYKYLSETMNLHWVKSGAFMSKPKNPNYEIKLDTAFKTVRPVNSIQFPNLLEKVKGGHVILSPKSVDILTFVVSLRRNVSFHIAQTYLPSAFFIVITWLCFLLPVGMAASRVGLTMTTLLTLNTMFNSVRTSGPQVTYAKAIDVWMVGIMFFAFLALVEFVLTSWLEAVKEREEKRAKEHDEEMKKLADMELFDAANEISEKKAHVAANVSSNIKRMDPDELRRFLKLRKFLKQHGHTIVASSFVLFIALYWVWICSGSEFFNWEVDPTYNEVD